MPDRLPIGMRVIVRAPTLPYDGQAGTVTKHVRRRSFTHEIRLDKPVRVRTRRGRRNITESWTLVLARTDELTPIELL